MKRILFFLSFACAGQLSAQVCFAPYNSFPAASQPSSIVSADFNGDSILDLAVSNKFSNNVSIFLGDGIGGFGLPSNFSVGVNPSSISIGDFNLDGKKDLVTSNEFGNNVSIILGNGTGGFGSVNNYIVGSAPSSVFSIDLNSDGNTDLVVSNSSSNNVSVLLGTGAGTFGAPSNFSVGFSGAAPIQVVCDDFNGDLKADIVIANNGSGVLGILLGNGIGGFGSLTTYTLAPSNASPTSVVVGDFNGDSKLDLASCNYSLNNVSILLGTGLGTFGSAINFLSGLAGPESITCADFDGDSNLDLALANITNNASVLLGTGTGSFGAPTIYSTGSNSSPASIIAGDFNTDTKPDLALGCSNSGEALVFLNCGMMAIDEIDSQNKVSISPNPATNQFFIETNSNESLTANLYDVNGRQVLSKIINEKSTIDVSNLDEGVYILRMKMADQIVNKKLVIVR